MPPTQISFLGNPPTSLLRCRGAPKPDEYMDPEGFGDEWADEWDGDPESSDQVMDPLFAPQDFICDEDDDDDLAPVGNHDDAELDGEPCFSVQKGM